MFLLGMGVFFEADEEADQRPSLYGGISDTFAAERFAHERSSDGHNNRYA